MTVEQINEKRKTGDIQRVAELSGISRKTIEAVIYGRRKPDTKKGKEVIQWFSNFIECRDAVSGDEKTDIHPKK
jgi:hypothetical protein